MLRSKTLWISAEACPAYPAVAESLGRAAVPATGPPVTGLPVTRRPVNGPPANGLPVTAFSAGPPRARRRAAPVSARGDPSTRIRQQKLPAAPMAQQVQVRLPARDRFEVRPVPRLFR